MDLDVGSSVSGRRVNVSSIVAVARRAGWEVVAILLALVQQTNRSGYDLFCGVN